MSRAMRLLDQLTGRTGDSNSRPQLIVDAVFDPRTSFSTATDVMRLKIELVGIKPDGTSEFSCRLTEERGDNSVGVRQRALRLDPSKLTVTGLVFAALKEFSDVMERE